MAVAAVAPGIGALALPNNDERDSSGQTRPAQEQSLDEVRALLARRAERNQGIPVGVVLLDARNVETLRQQLASIPGGTPLAQLRFRKVEQLPLPGKVVVVHLAYAEAGALEDGVLPEPLAAFLAETPAQFFPGIRLNAAWALGSGTGGYGGTVNITRGLPDPATAPAAASFSFAEIFAGIGGFRLGLEPLGGHCVLASEIDSRAVSTYRLNFSVDSGGSELVGDIMGQYCDQLPDFDVLTGGFPCQPFSNRGDQGGLGDDRGQLYLELVRLLVAKRPRAFLFENVVGLVVMDGGSRSTRGKEPFEVKPGQTFCRLLKAFADCGYDVSWRILNARHWLPQQRERVYIAGLRSDLGCAEMDWSELIPHATAEAATVREILEPADKVAACELTLQQWEKIKSQCHDGDCISNLRERAVQLDGKAPTLISSYHRVTNFSSKYLFEEADGTIRDGEQGRRRPRFFSPRECTRLMGFPESFKVPSLTTDPHQLAAYYRQIGNAVCPPVIRAIGDLILRCLKQSNA